MPCAFYAEAGNDFGFFPKAKSFHGLDNARLHQGGATHERAAEGRKV
jgi:hypothetical protein